MAQLGTVYLLHFDEALCHAQHYIGWAKGSYMDRVNVHLDGNGARIVAAAVARGIHVEVVKVWPGHDRDFERKLKNRKNARGLCPVCKPAYNERAAAKMRQARSVDTQ